MNQILLDFIKLSVTGQFSPFLDSKCIKRQIKHDTVIRYYFYKEGGGLLLWNKKSCPWSISLKSMTQSKQLSKHNLRC